MNPCTNFGKTEELNEPCVLKEGPNVAFKEMINVLHTEQGMK